ncbi:hypothetical protein INS49_004449 [Diaporthe citri]|uniref:uncharacterized protein n=1 Tax=Diaporthe citri TaxID=83186 RepID=UPI001C7FF0A7|nr:uncharacterized protein INS49_004449 [Diaporthe citri]KAG6354432.1 hypothetical protein INS49_004449 [Diaporthe citri]
MRPLKEPWQIADAAAAWRNAETAAAAAAGQGAGRLGLGQARMGQTWHSSAGLSNGGGGSSSSSSSANTYCQEHDLQRRIHRQEQQLAAQERDIWSWRRVPKLNGLSALLAPVVAELLAHMLAPFGVTCGKRRAKGKSKGEGEVCIKGLGVHEGWTLAEFVREIQRFQEGSDYGYQARRGTVTWDLLFRKKSLRKLLADLEEAGLEEEDVLVRDLLDGGETVYYRLYDE